MATLQEYMARRNMTQRSSVYGAPSLGSQGKYWWIREREDEDVLTAARRAGLYGSSLKQEAAPAGSDAGFLEKTWETGVDVVGNILSGAAKSLEGIFDLGLGAVGAVGGIFDKSVRDEMRRLVEYDFTGENISKNFDRWSDDSVLNNSKAGRITESVLSGVGQMLPTVAISLATGGAATPAMLALGASAAGNATEEAFNDGADYYRGLGYGVVSGGVEVATEKIFGGLGGLLGGGMLDNVTRSVAKTGAARVVKDMVGEAAEEALAEVVNPLARTIYKGRDALSDYGSADYWGGVGEAALVGGLTSAAYGGTVGRALKTSGKYADVAAVKEEIEAIEKKRDNLETRGKFTAQAEAQASRAERENLTVLENILRRSNDKKRAELIRRYRLEGTFESDGSIKESVIKRLDGAENSAASVFKREYYSPSLRGREDLIRSDLAAVGERAGTVVKVFDGELSEVAQKNYVKTKKALSALNRAGGNDVSLVITEASDKYKGGLVDDRTIYMSADQLGSGDYAATLVHEFTHFEEGTKEYSKMLDFLSSDEIVVDDGKGGRAILRERAEAAVEAKGYGVTKEGAQVLLDKVNAGEELTSEEAKTIRLYATEVAANETEILLGNESFIDRIVREDASTAQKLVGKILSLDKAFSTLKDKEAQAQHKLVRKAERLYLKAAEAAGNGNLKKMILAQRPELEEKVQFSFENGKSEADHELVDFYKAVLSMQDNNAKNKRKKRIGIVSETHAMLVSEIIKKETGKEIDLSGYEIWINGGAVTHIEERHGKEGKADHSMADEQNIARIPWAMDGATFGEVLKNEDGSFDLDYEFKNSDQTPSYKVRVSRQVDNGLIFVTECVPDSASKQLHIISAYMQKSDKGQELYGTDDSPKPTAEPHLDSDVTGNSIPHSPEKSTETEKKVSTDGKVVQMSLAEGTNQQTAEDIDALIKSAGIEGEAAEIREELADLYDRARNIVNGAEDDADLKKGKAFVERVAKRIAGNMAHDVDGETREEMAERLRREILAKTEFAEPEAKATEDAKKDEPKPKKTGYTYDDVHGMMDAVKKMLSFEMSSGRVVEGKIYRNDGWDVGKKIYQTLKAGELRKKSTVAREVADLIVDVVKVEEWDAYGKKITRRLTDVLHGEELEAARQEVALEIAMQMGDREAKKYNKRMADVKYEAQRLSDMKKGRYVNAANYKNETFKKALSELARTNWRGGLVSSKKIRERFSELAQWYTPSNPLYGSGGVKNEMFRQSIFDALDFVGDTTRGALTMEDIDAAEMILKYFIHEIENYGTIFKNGKREDAMPLAKGYITKAEQAKAIVEHSGVMQGILRNKAVRMIADPGMLFREADSHIEGGFFTEQFEEMRRGTIDASVREHEMLEEFVSFWEDNKEYGKRYNAAEVDFAGKKMPLQEAIALYMTMKRDHAFAGLAYAGFEIEGKRGTVNVSNGFGDVVEKYKIELINKLPPEKALNMSKADESELHTRAIAAAVNQARGELYDQFTAEDKRLIAIMERGFEGCRDVKVKIDKILTGDSNVTGGYYFPIKRAGLAENIDVVSMFEGDRVTNLSFNKDTVKNAHKLLIEPVHVVYMRHVKAMALYDGLGVFTDNFNRLYNLNTTENANNPVTIRTTLSQSGNHVKEMLSYFKELKQDVEGISKKRSSERFYNDIVAEVRSAYAAYQLGFNPKTWASQFSSLIASTSKLDLGNVVAGLSMSGADVDDYCKLAWLRNNDGDAVLAQSVTTGMNPVQRSGRNALQKVRDVAMLPIGKVDRIVVEKLFAACQVQVEKKQGIKAGTRENKVAAGELLETVILETQQNSMATERTAAMRSGDEMLKGFNMFIADAMKVQARMVEPYARLASLRTQRRMAVDAKNQAEVARLDKKIEETRKECVRATSVLVGVSVFNALLAYGFKWLYRRDDEEDVSTIAADTVGNMIGGIPFVRDAYSYFVDGFEAEHFAIATLNDVLKTTADTAQLLQDAADGKDVSQQEALKAVRDVLYAAGQLSGVPTRNLYNNITGIVSRASKKADYVIDGTFYKPSYASDLAAAIEADDEGMISLIASMMIEDKVGNVDAALSAGLLELVEKGHNVLPRVLGDSITYDGEKVTLTKRQRERFKAVYAVAHEQILSMMKLRQYAEASEEVRAKAIKMIWDVYWDLAVDDVLGVDSSEKNVLFAEAIDMDKLALIVATAREIKADYNEAGKAISGTRLAKIEAYVEKLNLKAAQKYMIMGYLGYKNKNGEEQVRAYINGLTKLSKAEKEKLMEYAGYQ